MGSARIICFALLLVAVFAGKKKPAAKPPAKPAAVPPTAPESDSEDGEDDGTLYDPKKKEYEKVRAALAKKWGITDKGHAHHGKNFDKPQTMEQIELNLLEGLQKMNPAQEARYE